MIAPTNYRYRSCAVSIKALSCPEPHTGCWLWTGAMASNGYGYMRRNGKQLLAHRVSFSTFRGEIPAGLSVCHRCDTPVCVNPDHLFLGTNADNVADRVRKGRSNRTGRPGRANGNAKLTDAAVVAMRALRKGGATCAALGQLFGVARETAGDVCSGRRWGHV